MDLEVGVDIYTSIFLAYRLARETCCLENTGGSVKLK
jgi:hypothetical protein